MHREEFETDKELSSRPLLAKKINKEEDRVLDPPRQKKVQENLLRKEWLEQECEVQEFRIGTASEI